MSAAPGDAGGGDKEAIRQSVDLTVLLPVYNGARHLKKAVDSILAQTYRDFELLVIDDGSTDQTPEILQSLDDPRLRVIRQPNSGLVAALNRGLSEARTELIARMDADDISAPTRLEEQRRLLLDQSQIALVGCCYWVMDETGRVAGCQHVAAAPRYLRRRLYFRNTLAHTSIMFRRSVAQSFGGYRDVGPVEDYYLWSRIAAAHEIAALPEPLVSYRVSTSSISGLSTNRQAKDLKAARTRLHKDVPLEVPHPLALVSEGLAHERQFSTCGDAGFTYVYDHAWLAVVTARAGRPLAGGWIALGVVLLLLRRPYLVFGLPGLRTFRRPQPWQPGLRR